MELHDAEPAVASAPLSEPSFPEDVRGQLERLVESSLFRSSRRCQSLLRHIVERTLTGDIAALKERTLGVDVFHRSPDYDTNADPVVRGTAGEIRKKLAQYYQAPDHGAEFRIELRPGSYVPEFHPPGTLPPPAPPPPAPSRWRPLALIGIGAAGALALAALALLSFRAARDSDLDHFWAPLLDPSESALFCIGQARAYTFRDEMRKQEIAAIFESIAAGTYDASGQKIPLLDLIQFRDRYTPLGDALCLARLSAFLEKKGQSYRARGASSTTFTDLRERSAILIGAFDNEWTLRITGNMRYFFQKDLKTGTEMIRDRSRPDRVDWKLVNAWPDWKITQDYAIACRAFDTGTDRWVVAAAGITHFGTLGAGEFLTNRQYFSEVVPKLPRGWEKKNIEIVLRIPVVQGSSGHPEVLAAHAW